MKQKDIAIIIIVVTISALASYFLSNALFAAPDDRRMKVEVVERIDTSFERPDAKYFNSQSLNPSKQIRIGDSPNNTPFNTPAQ
jgi:hypothetical protein